jgi:hypothetical protein
MKRTPGGREKALQYRRRFDYMIDRHGLYDLNGEVLIPVPGHNDESGVVTIPSPGCRSSIPFPSGYRQRTIITPG